MTHGTEGGRAEARSAVKPVIVAKLVNLNSPPVRRRMRHGLCRHRQRVIGVRLNTNTIILQEIGREIDVLLERKLSIGMTEESERRHVSSRPAR